MRDDTKKASRSLYSLRLVGLPGFEPRMTGPESVVLPLHHSPIASAKVGYIFAISKKIPKKVLFLLRFFEKRPIFK